MLSAGLTVSAADSVPDRPYNPLNPQGFSLLVAVYPTLQHDQNLRLAELTVQASAGSLQAARGARRVDDGRAKC